MNWPLRQFGLLFFMSFSYVCPCHFETTTSSGKKFWLKVLAILLTIDDTILKKKGFDDACKKKYTKTAKLYN